MQDRLSHRPSELSGGQQQRVAIARALISRPTVLFADEPTGNLDSTTSDEILELLRRSVDDYGQTIVMVTHDARAAAVAHRVLFLADGEIVRELGQSNEHEILDGHGRGRRSVIKVALRGLAGRKLRAVLTAIAIVLGVAMISGTYILTDTINSAFTTLFTESYAGTDAVVTGKGLDISIDGETPPKPPVDASLLETVRGVEGVALASGSVLDERYTKILNREGKAVSSEGAPTFGFGIDTDPALAQFNPLSSSRGAGRPLRTRWSSTREQRTTDGFKVGDTVEITTLKPKRPFKLVGVARYGSVDSIGNASFAVFTIPAAQELLEREGQYDAISVAATEGVDRGRARRGDRAGPPGQRDGRERDGGGRRGGGRGQRVHVHLPLLPPRLRRHRALRGRVRHLQHVLDHRRPAHARVRDAADDRRLPTAGSRLGHPRVARHRTARVAHRARSRRAPGRGDRGALPHLSESSCRRRTACSQCAR